MDAASGLSQLRSWASPAFSPEPMQALLSSNICSADVLLFVLEHVFGWGDAPTTRSRTDRKKALGFVTQWLGRDPPGDEKSSAASAAPKPNTPSVMPSLARLCAQRIAMEIFPTLCDELDRQFDDENLGYFTDTLRKNIASSLSGRGVPEYCHDSIAEEVSIFVIVYFLCIDIRKMTGNCPPLLTELQLPVGDEHENDDDEYERLRRIVDPIPNHGRGSLAKVSLVAHAACNAYRQALAQDEEVSGFNYIETIDLLFDERGRTPHTQHPFAYSAVLAPVLALVCALVLGDDAYEHIHEHIYLFVTKTLVPWAGRTRPDQSSYSYLRLATTQMDTPKQPPPMLPPFSSRKAVEGCIDAIQAQELLNEIKSCRKPGGVKRLRLNGNFSKGEILYASIVSAEAVVVDLENCWNLDEECLGLCLHHLKDVKVILLKGTAINEKSGVVKRANVSRKQVGEPLIDFVFSDACKCCGRRSGSIKELQISRPIKKQRMS